MSEEESLMIFRVCWCQKSLPVFRRFTVVEATNHAIAGKTLLERNPGAKLIFAQPYDAENKVFGEMIWFY